MINAVEARNNAKQNSDYNRVMIRIYNAIEKESKEGKFHVIVKPDCEYKFTCWKELESHGFEIENVMKGIYPTGEIKVKW